jgi:hypothetical protein
VTISIRRLEEQAALAQEDGRETRASVALVVAWELRFKAVSYCGGQKCLVFFGEII